MSSFIAEQLALHPSIAPQDVIKMCFQAAYGAEHLLTDMHKVREYFLAEYNFCEKNSQPVAEFIAPEVCRVNLGAWKKLALPWEWLFNLFVRSASVSMEGGDKRFFEYVNEWSGFVQNNGQIPGFSYGELQAYIQDYLAKCEGGKPQAVHHSQQYRDSEKPAYRVISGPFVRLVPILVEVAGQTGKSKGSVTSVGAKRSSILRHQLNPSARVVSQSPFLRGWQKFAQQTFVGGSIIAIDGRAASGKSTLAAGLRDIIGAEAIHMDDFFLPPELRTATRLSEPGGNIHYERFAQEVLPHLASGRGFEYRIFDCDTNSYNGTRKVVPSPWRVVEGSYSHHPRFGDYADVRVFSTVDSMTQMERITARNGTKMAAMFAAKWIPMEEAYFEAYDIAENATCV